MGENNSDKIGQALLAQNGYTIQDLDTDNLTGIYMREYFLDPLHVELLGKVSIMNSRSEGCQYIFALSPNANLTRLALHRNFDLRAMPAND